MTYKKMLFVCLGNSCSSPLAEAIMQHLMVKTSLYWEIDSAGLRTWNIGRRPHKRCMRILKEHGLRSDHYCRLFTVQDFRYFDFIVAMDMHVYKELLLWAGLNRSAKHCEVQMLGWYGQNGQGALIHDLSPTHKLKLFRDAYYQIKECCKQFILNQQVHIVQYDLPSTEEDEPPAYGQEEPQQQQQNQQTTLVHSEPALSRYKLSPPEPKSSVKSHKKKLCQKCGQKFLAAL